MSKRLKSKDINEAQHTERIMSSENNCLQSQSCVINNSLQPITLLSNDPYHESICGSILLPLPTNSPSEIFSYLRHGKFDKFRRCLDVYHKEIIQIKNEHEQTVLHILTIHAYPYQWIRLLLMRECDPCYQDIDGYTAAHYAAERDDVEMLKALTTRFYSEIKLFSNQKIITIHERCLKALSIRQKHGLTVFMLCCQYQSIKCLNYLFELQINDANLQDNFGDTCLHYAVARRNEILIDILINQCNANINGGSNTRPSVLDIVQFNRDQQKSFNKTTDDSIERILLSHHALNRCQIRRIINKRKISCDNDESALSNLVCLTVDSSIRTGRNYARLAISSENNGDISNTQEYYKLAMDSIPNDTLDWTDYAFNAAIIHMNRGENQLALELLRQALIIRNRFEKETEEITKIQRAIDTIEKHI